MRALLAFAAAQSSLLYGYSLWGGIKEVTAAFLLALGAVLVAAHAAARVRLDGAALIPLAIVAGALIQTLGAGGAAFGRAGAGGRERQLARASAPRRAPASQRGLDRRRSAG